MTVLTSAHQLNTCIIIFWFRDNSFYHEESPLIQWVAQPWTHKGKWYFKLMMVWYTSVVCPIKHLMNLMLTSLLVHLFSRFNKWHKGHRKSRLCILQIILRQKIMTKTSNNNEKLDLFCLIIRAKLFIKNSKWQGVSPEYIHHNI